MNPTETTQTSSRRAHDPEYFMKLYLTGDEANSRLAKTNLKRICENHLMGNCHVQIIDVLREFQTAIEDKIFITPALVITKPVSLIIYGNLKDTGKILENLGIITKENCDEL